MLSLLSVSPMKAELSPISVDCLARELEGCCLVLVDIRPSSQHCSSHIQSSENINFTNILLRRLMKGVVKLNTHVSNQELVEKLMQRDPSCTKLVLYDNTSKKGCIKSELTKHAEVLYKTCSLSTSTQVYYLDGGFTAFSEHYPTLCETNSPKSSHAPIGISLSASLPINFARFATRQQSQRAQTLLEDEASRFGPPVEILPFLVLGCARDSSNLALLREHGVTAVLNVSHNCVSHFKELFEYKIIPVQDSHQADLLSQLDTAFEFIDSIKAKGGKVFVHCHAGISRSATVCIAYIMKHRELSLSKSYDFVKQKRPCISPNLHFMGQLLTYEKGLQEESPNKDSALFFEPPLPMDIESIPVSIIATPHEQPKSGVDRGFNLRLPLQFTSINDRKCRLKRKVQSASAPTSVDIPSVPEVDETTTPSNPKSIRTSIEIPSYNYELMGQFYSSTDGMLYPVKSVQIQTGSLPATPVESPRHMPTLTTCRTQIMNLQSSLGNSKPLDTSLSPCRVVACNGGRYV